MRIKNKIYNTLLLSILLFVSWSIQAAPKIETWKTSGGTEVYYVHAPELPMVDIEVVFDAGSSRDGELPGLSAMTNGFTGSGRRWPGCRRSQQGF